jgi:lysozyme family protein
MTSLEAFVEGVLDREGRTYGDRTTVPMTDQPTAAGGITAAAYAEDIGIPVGQVTPDMLKSLTVDQARGIIRRRVQRELVALRFDRILFEPLRLQMLDFAHNSGATGAVKWLQRAVGLPEALCDGLIGERTLAALGRYPQVLVNNAHGGVTDQKLAWGVARRAVEFALSTIGDNDGEEKA